MKNTIEFLVKESYGNKLIYVSDPEMARSISQLTGRKTLTRSDVQALKALGFEFKQVMDAQLMGI